MALKGTWIWIFSLAVLSCSAVQDETVLKNCSSLTRLFERLSSDLKAAAECDENLPSAWSVQQSAELLFSMKNLTDSLEKHQLKECHDAEPNRCPEAEVPKNGGLVCVTIDSKRYCKPMCNNGYDFSFIRRSRLFDECSERTGYKWDTQYIGGNKLAVCNQALTQIAGAASAYFPKDQDCLTVKRSSQLQSGIIAVFTSELRRQGIQPVPEHACLVCG